MPWIKEYKEKVQKELEDLCNKICNTIEASLLPKAQTDEAKVFYHKMKGDYYRYIAENVEGELKKKYSDLGKTSYENALSSAESISYTSPVKLGLALNLSVFYYEVIGDKDKAIKLAEETIEKGREALKTVDEEEDESKDSMSIVSLLEENLEMWKNEDNE